MSRIGVGIVTRVYDEGAHFSVRILMTDSYGRTIESDCIAERKLFLEGDKVIGFQMFNENTGSYFTFVTLAK